MRLFLLYHERKSLKPYSLSLSVRRLYLDTKHQILLNDVIDYNCCEVNARQGTQIKKHYLDGDLSGDKINEILKGEEIKKPKEKISINYTRLKEYFPKEYTPQQCEQALWEILDKWFRTKE